MASSVYDAVAVAIQTPGIHGTMGVPVLLWGPPGIGKSHRLHALFARLDRLLAEQGQKAGGLFAQTIIAALRGPEDFAGWPKVEGEGAGMSLRMIPSDFAVKAAAAKRAVIFLDELSTAERATQKALLRAVCEGHVGDLKMPASVSWVAAANPQNTAADGHTMAPAFANRWIHLDVPSTSTDEFASYLMGGSGADPMPPVLDIKAWAVQFRTVRALGAQFLKIRPAFLHSLPDSEEAQGREWASPRTWEIGLRAYAAGLAVNSPEIALMLLQGAVGKPAVEFATWAAEQDLPDPVAVLRGQVQFTIDRSRLDRAIVTLSACAAASLEIAVTDQKERTALVDQFYGLCDVAEQAGVLDVAVPGATVIASRYRGAMGPKMMHTLSPQRGLGKMLAAVGVV